MKPIAQYRKHTREQDKNLDKVYILFLKQEKYASNEREVSTSSGDLSSRNAFVDCKTSQFAIAIPTAAVTCGRV